MKKTTIHEIAKALGIDSSTVSRALNDSDRVKLATKKKVRAKAKELGYNRNLLASNLRQKKSNTIGVIVPRISRYFFSSTIAGIEKRAQESGYNVIICQSLEEVDRERKIIRNLMANRVDGILISVTMQTKDSTHLTECFEKGTPLVFFDRHVAGMKQTGKVLIDDIRGGYQATEHLIEQGYQTIAHITGPLDVEIYKNRHQGYRSALEKYGIFYERDLVFTSDLRKEEGYGLAGKLRQKYPDVDAIFCANDFSALGALRYMKENGIKVPEEFGIAGFSNEPTTAVIEPSLTTVDQSGTEIGRLACELLIDYFTNGNTLVNDKTVMLEPKLIVRNSTLRSGSTNSQRPHSRLKSTGIEGQ